MQSYYNSKIYLKFVATVPFFSYAMQHFNSQLRLSKDLTDEELIAACVKRDQAAQCVIYKRYYGTMLALCIRYVGSRETAKDIVQDGFIVLFDKINTYANLGSFEGWAKKIFINLSLSYLRKSDALRYTEQADTTNVPQLISGNILENMSAQDLLKCIASMPEGFRTVFNLHALEGFQHNEIAKMLHIREGTSRSQYTRARVWLQNKLKSQQ